MYLIFEVHDYFIIFIIPAPMYMSLMIVAVYVFMEGVSIYIFCTNIYKQ